MARAAEVQANEDRQRRAEIEERNLAECACHGTERRIADLTEKLAMMLQTRVADVRSALESDDIARLRVAREAMEQTFLRISEEISR